MIITVSGLTGSGKNTLGELLAKELGYNLVCPTFKDLAKKEGISLMEFQKKAENDSDIDKKFDEVLKEQAKGDCIVTTWLGPWMIDADIRIKIFASVETRAKRIAKRDGMELEEAIAHVKQRDENNRKRYKKIYGIDIDSEENFDAKFDSGIFTPEELLRKSLKIIKK